MKRGEILISGATGFVGQHLASSFLSDGWKLLILVRPDTNQKKLPESESDIQLITLSELRSKAFQIRLGKCSAWINAATAYGRNNGNSIEEVKFANIDYPLEILDQVIKAKCRTAINFDSFFTKEELTHNYLPAYTASKKEFLKHAELRLNSSSTTLFNLRLEHVYGPLDSPTKFTTWVLSQLLKNVTQIPLTVGTQERDFIYIDDVVSATKLVLHSAPRQPGSIENYPIGTGIKTSIETFVRTAKEVCESTTHLDFGSIPQNEQDIRSSCADISKLVELGWESPIALNKGIALTIANLRQRLDLNEGFTSK